MKAERNLSPKCNSNTKPHHKVDDKHKQMRKKSLFIFKITTTFLINSIMIIYNLLVHIGCNQTRQKDRSNR